MTRALQGRIKQGAALLAALLFLAMAVARAADASGPVALFARVDRTCTTDHAVFLQTLQELHRRESALTPDQVWKLRYWDAWETAFEGRYAQAEPLVREVIAQAGDQAVEVRASALLLNILSLQHHYEEAYSLAHDLVVRLPQVADTAASVFAVSQVSQLLSSAGQSDLALKYALQMKARPLDGRSLCLADFLEIDALLGTAHLRSDSPKFRSAIGSCLAVGEIVTANTIRLDQASLMTDEGHEDEAIALLRQIEPGVRKAGYQFHVASLQANLALAYLDRGSRAAAEKSAQAALAAAGGHGFNWVRSVAYEVLYQVAKKAGRSAAALGYYEKYVALDKAAMDDAKARALAYQMVRQEVLAKKLRLDALDKQNKILKLNRQLDRKAAETARLYIALLLAVIGFIVLWLYRLKQSQVHFRRMARHDGLTGVFNRHHFLDESGRTLVRLHKAGAPACLVVLDLDHFKRVNDTYGHIVGDDVLRRVAQVVRSELRASDLFGRLGGEEFGILMPSCTRVQGLEIAERIRAALAAAHITLDDGCSITVSGSLGLACTDAYGYVLRDLLTRADAALYEAKRAGRDRVVTATSDAVAAFA